MVSTKAAVGRVLVAILLVVILGAPLAWIGLVSVQKSEVAFRSGYDLLPQAFTLENYQHILLENQREIRSALLLTTWLDGIAALLGFVEALALMYLIKGSLIQGGSVRRWTHAAIGLYFLPAVAVYPGLAVVGKCLPMAARARGQVLIAHIVLAFVLSFVLLLMVMASVRRSQYESMLLTTRSRLKSFWFVYVQQRLLGVVAVFALALATVWSDFFLPAMFCSSEPVKPFAVVLQMANQQYETDYSIFAAGAVLSIAAVVVVAAVVSGLYSAAFWLWGGPEWKARLRLK